MAARSSAAFFHDASSLPSWVGLSAAGRAEAGLVRLARPLPPADSRRVQPCVLVPTTVASGCDFGERGGRPAGGMVPLEACPVFLRDVGLARLAVGSGCAVRSSVALGCVSEPHTPHM